jgi:hypothetical protein
MQLRPLHPKAVDYTRASSPLPREPTAGSKELLGRLAEEKEPIGVCPAGVTSLLKRRALSGKEPFYERLGAFENLGRSGDPR